MNSTNPTSGVCRPLYYEDYFIFDRESLLSISSPSASADLTVVRNHEGHMIQLYTSEMRTVTDIIFWGFIVLLVSLLLLSLTFCCHCCLCYITRRRSRSTQRKNTKMPFLTVFGCGIFTGAVILLSFVDSVVLLWMEIDLNQNFTGQADFVQHYVNITTDLSRGDNDTVKQIVLDPLFQLQNNRFWITLAFLGSLMVILAITFLSVCICTPISKSSAPVVTMLIVDAFCTLFASIAASVLFGILLFFSVACYDLYRLGGGRWCDQTLNAPLVQTVGRFCGRESFNRFYTMAGVYGILILLLVLGQLTGGVYTVVVTQGYKERPQRRRQTNQHIQQRRPQHQHQHRSDQQHPSRTRNIARSTSTSTSTATEETFILRSRDPSHYHHHRPQRQNSSSIGYREVGTNLDSRNLNISSHTHDAFNMSKMSYPKEAPPSYDEVIRRDSESSISVPLIASPVSQGQGLSSVPEDDEPLNESQVDQPDTGTSNQEDSAIVEENVHADDEP